MIEVTKDFLNVSLKPRELENNFRDESLSRDKKLTEIIMAITLILIILFIGLDFSLLQENKVHPIWTPTRFVAAIASIIGFWLVHRQTNAQRIDRITFVWGLINICHLLIINSTRINNHAPVYVWDIITIIGIYFLVPFPYRYKIITAFVFSISSGVIWFIFRIPYLDPYENLAILAGYFIANVYGVFISRQDNQIRREHYILLTTDSLTGVSNRRHFFNQLPRELERTKRYGNPFSIVLFDLDNLKEINDKYGHDAGDKLIRSFAKHCSSQLRRIDQFARFGGDEFIALLVQTGQEDAKEVAERIKASTESLKIQIDQETITTTVSIGLTTVKEDVISAEELIKRADQALYDAKNSGRNQVAIM